MGVICCSLWRLKEAAGQNYSQQSNTCQSFLYRAKFSRTADIKLIQSWTLLAKSTDKVHWKPSNMYSLANTGTNICRNRDFCYCLICKRIKLLPNRLPSLTPENMCTAEHLMWKDHRHPKRCSRPKRQLNLLHGQN